MIEKEAAEKFAKKIRVKNNSVEKNITETIVVEAQACPVKNSNTAPDLSSQRGPELLSATKPQKVKVCIFA